MTYDTQKLNAKFENISTEINELKVCQAVVSEQVKLIDKRFGDVAKKFDTFGDQQEKIHENISDIKDSISALKVNKATLDIDTAWLKKIATLILTALLSGGGILGYFKITEQSVAEKTEVSSGLDSNRDG